MINACIIPECDQRISKSKIMCMRHWRRVPRSIKERICDAYIPGYSRGVIVAQEFIDAMKDAVLSVREDAYRFARK